MGSHSQKMIFMALILTVAIPISTSQTERSRRLEQINDTEQRLRDLCTETMRSEACWNILKPKLNEFHGPDDISVARGVTNLAIKKSKEIFDELLQHYSVSNDDGLKKKYLSCSKNYYNANCNLVMARRNLDDDRQSPNILDEVEVVDKELKICGREFGEESFDSARVRDRNEEFGLYRDIFRAASARLPFTEDSEVY